MTDRPLQHEHRRNCREDVVAIFWCAAQNLDYRSYARWLAEFRRINLETLPRFPLRRENLNVLFSRNVNEHFMHIYMAADTGPDDSPEAARNFILEDTREAIAAALAHLQDDGNLNRVRALAAAKLDPAMVADTVLQPAALPDEDELRRRLALRLARL